MSIGAMRRALAIGTNALVVHWDDGVLAQIDLAPIIAAHPALAPLGDPEIFQEARLSEDGWSVEWPSCGVDFGAPQLRRWADEQAGRTMSHKAFRAWIDSHGFTLEAAARALSLSPRTLAHYLSGDQPVPRRVLLATMEYDRGER
jgi:hypothetical protein